MASVSGKVVKEVEIKASPEQYYNIFRKQSQQIPNIANKNVHHVELHEGDYQTHGSIKTWKYTTGKKYTTGDEMKTLKARTEFDDVNKKTTFVGLGGDAMKYYKVLNIAYQVIPKGNGQGSLVKLSVEYEKLNEDMPVPNMYLDTMTIVTKDMDDHLINA